ncbi:MAG: hypothetical protein AB1894_08080 [Chloroflexota bacterium]
MPARGWHPHDGCGIRMAAIVPLDQRQGLAERQPAGCVNFVLEIRPARQRILDDPFPAWYDD